jgi:hypothetical protein
MKAAGRASPTPHRTEGPSVLLPDRPSAGPPYRTALVVSAVVLAGLLLSLAPSVTFWDAGEFGAAMKTLGIPHPPGTPLFVLMGHVWGMLFPFGEYAFRTNLMSALFASAGAGCWFLVLHEAADRSLTDMDPGSRRALRTAAGAAGALLAAFGFSNWLNSNETEVYAVATFTIGAVTWFLLRWRAARGTPRAIRFLLLIAYLLGIAIGNHLLGMLVGPAVVAFVVAEILVHPAADPAQNRHEWGDAALLAGLWLLLLGVGLGSTRILIVGGLAFLAALGFAASRGELGFAALMLGIALVGVTPCLFLYLRSAQHPIINEAAPETWKALLAVIRRDQYPPRTPFDNPTQLSGPGNSGRTLGIIGLQLVNYAQYFDWQWAMAFPGSIPLPGGLSFPLRTVFTLGFLGLGLRGLFDQWRTDRSGGWLLLVLFLTTGLGLVAYMNFKPGYSMGYGDYPNAEDHEVRDRDYFFVVSFVVWGLWAGLGLLALARRLAERLSAGSAGPAGAPAGRSAGILSYTVFAAALVPFALNFPAADRRHGPDARLPGDFAYDLLNSVPPYGVLFTYGDNDTFPLWWAQEVAGVRRDVTVICLALAQTSWNMRQLRDNPVRPFEEGKAPALWRGRNPVKPTWPLHTMTDAEIDSAVPQLLTREVTLPVGRYTTTLHANTPLYGNDFLSLRVIQQNFGRRPIGWALTAVGNGYGLDRFLVQRGLAVALDSTPVDTTDRNLDLHRMLSAPLDVPMTERLMTEVYRYADLLHRPRQALESTSSGIASTIGLPFTQLAYAMEQRADTAKMIKYLELASHLSSNPAVMSALRALQARHPSTGR